MKLNRIRLCGNYYTYTIHFNRIKLVYFEMLNYIQRVFGKMYECWILDTQLGVKNTNRIWQRFYSLTTLKVFK